MADEDVTLKEVWLLPPLGIARLGPSPTPCPNFQWGPNDVAPRGTGKTTIVPAETLDVAEDGTITSHLPDTVEFRDEAGIRPVCTFFELHGRWGRGDGDTTGPVTATLLESAGLSLRDLRWDVEVANLKAFHMTLSPGDRVSSRVAIAGDDTGPRSLPGSSPEGVERPLVSPDRPVPLGTVQVTRADGEFPGIRLHFTPAAGHVHAPTDLADRSAEYPIRAEHRTLNPDAAWVGFLLTDDARTNPGGLFATDDRGRSLGFVDDVCDGIVRCTVPGLPPARSRIAVGPPRYAPDRRPFVSLADGFADRVQRLEVSEPGFVEAESTTYEVRDLMERVWETVGLSNVDFQNVRARSENRAVAAAQGLPPEAAAGKVFPVPETIEGLPLPLTEHGRLQHHRLLALEVFEDLLREQPEMIDRVIRPPGTSDQYYDRRMPALYRGSDRHPMHVTRRQYDLLRAWAMHLRQSVGEDT